MTVDGSALHFGSVEAFSFALQGRAGIPFQRLNALLGQSNSSLLRQAEEDRRVRRRLENALFQGDSDGPNVSAFLASFDARLFSEDCGWRVIFSAFETLDPTADPFKKTALEKYCEFLTAREETTRAIFGSRRGARSTPEARTDSRTRSSEALKDTWVLGPAAENGEARQLRRLSKGKPLEVDLRAHSDVVLALVKHFCRLQAGPPPLFIDAQGRVTPLLSPKLIVGRDSRADIRILSDRRDISRRHLIIENLGGFRLRLTDLSSLGTFVPPELMPEVVEPA